MSIQSLQLKWVKCSVGQWSPTHRSRSTGRSLKPSMSVPELSGFTGCGCAADQLCVGCLLFTHAVSATAGGAAGLSPAFPSIQVGLCTKLNTRTLWSIDMHLQVC